MTALVRIKEERLEVQSKIEEILNRDLELLAEKERSIGRWFALLGRNEDLKNTAEELTSLENKLVDLEKRINLLSNN